MVTGRTASDIVGLMPLFHDMRISWPKYILGIALYVLLCHYRDMFWWVVLIIPALWLGRGHLGTSVLIYGLMIVPLYLVSLARHSRRVCRACGGSGRHRGAMFTWGDRACTVCGGQSRHRRWGVQALYSGSQTWAERAGARARKRRGAPR